VTELMYEDAYSVHIRRYGCVSQNDARFALYLVEWITLNPCRARAMLLVRSSGIEGRSEVTENARRLNLGSAPGAGTRCDMQPPIIACCWLDQMNETL